ncbi:MAG: hypothetical protein GY754_44880, partial [bacterium]|nr:hypothetical protein [bacterium]
MQIYLKEKIGKPELFTGRKERLETLLTWVYDIKNEISQSKALLSRRKTGKTALLQRLYNTVFEANNGVIPFYYEMKEGSRWALEFCEDFFLTFIYQYIAFKTRKNEYIHRVKRTLNNAIIMAEKEGLDYLVDLIENVKERIEDEKIDILWDLVRDAPREVAGYNDERVVQIIDEFQFMNRVIYWDKEKTNIASDFVGGYLHTAEYKNAPLLVSGSWIGWLMDDLISMLPGRFFMETLENIPEEEAIEMILKYSHIQNEPVTEETVYLMAQLTEGSPFYISSLFRSPCPDRDLSTAEGVLKTLEFETQNPRGIINGTWMEYINAAFPRVNDLNAKRIVLYLCKEREREVSRKELREKLNLTMSEGDLEKRLNALIYSDIIEQGRSNFYYRGVQDNIFDKVFRGRYADD